MQIAHLQLHITVQIAHLQLHITVQIAHLQLHITAFNVKTKVKVNTMSEYFKISLQNDEQTGSWVDEQTDGQRERETHTHRQTTMMHPRYPPLYLAVGV